MQQENGEVHSYAKLQHSGQRLSNIADLPQKNIGAEIIGDGKHHAQHKQQGDHRFLHAEKQDQQGSAYGAKDIQRHFLLHQGPGILQNCGHSTNKAILTQQAFDLPLRRHSSFMRAGVFKPHDQHGRAAIVVEKPLQIGRQHFLWSGNIDQIAHPQDALYPFDSRKLFFQRQGIRRSHILHRDHGDRGHVEIFLQIPFSYDRFQLFRQVSEDIVVYISSYRPHHRRDQQQNSQKQHQLSALDHPTGKSFHTVASFLSALRVPCVKLLGIRLMTIGHLMYTERIIQK